MSFPGTQSVDLTYTSNILCSSTSRGGPWKTEVERSYSEPVLKKHSKCPLKRTPRGPRLNPGNHETPLRQGSPRVTGRPRPTEKVLVHSLQMVSLGVINGKSLSVSQRDPIPG